MQNSPKSQERWPAAQIIFLMLAVGDSVLPAESDATAQDKQTPNSCSYTLYISPHESRRISTMLRMNLESEVGIPKSDPLSGILED